MDNNLNIIEKNNAIYIPIKLFSKVCNIKYSFQKEVNESLFLLTYFLKNQRLDLIKRVIINKNSINLDLKDYINYLCELNDIKNDEIGLNKLNEIKEKIVSNEINKNNIDTFVPIKIQNFFKDIKKAKSRKKALYKYYLINIRALIKLLSDEEKYSHVSPNIVDIEKLTILINKRKRVDNSIDKNINIKEYKVPFFKKEENLSNYLEGIRINSLKETNDKKLLELLKRKVSLYKEINIDSINIGVDSYNGYIGFNKDNYVILDKLFNNQEENKIADENAIYIVRKEDFEKIILMTKTEAIDALNKGIINGKRLIHNNTFENRVKKYIKNK